MPAAVCIGKTGTLTSHIDIKLAQPQDVARLNTIVAQCGLFQPEEVDFVQGMIADHFGGMEVSGSFWVISSHCAAYVAPETLSHGAWNVLFIATLPAARGMGHGCAMMADIEGRLTAKGARLLLVETSGTPNFARTRAFYDRLGYERCGRIAGYFGPGDDKVIFAKSL